MKTASNILRTVPTQLASCIALALACPFADAAPQLVQTIDLHAWAGTPISNFIPALPQPGAPFSMTSIAFDPISKTIYAADYSTKNVFMIDSARRTVRTVLNVNGYFSTLDIGPTQNVQGMGPKDLLVNPATGSWAFTGQGGGARFNGTTFAEGINMRAMQSGAAWDIDNNILYGAEGNNFYATKNLKFVWAGIPCGGASNAVAVNQFTSRAYATCDAQGGIPHIAMFDGTALAKVGVKAQIPPILLGPTGIAQQQPTGIAVNPNTNRIYSAGLTGSTSLDVLDASSLAWINTIGGLPDQSSRSLVAGYLTLPLPRPIAINTRTNTIFVLNSVDSTVSVVDGKTNQLTATLAIAIPAGAITSQPAAGQMSEFKPGNTSVDKASNTLVSLGGAISMAVNEADNLLYVLGVNGTIGVFALDAPSSAPSFSVSGVVRDALGTAVPGVAVTATGSTGPVSTVTDTSGLYVLTGLAAGAYTVAPATLGSTSFVAKAVTLNAANVGKLNFAPAVAVAGGGGGNGGAVSPGAGAFAVTVSLKNAGTVTATPSGVDRSINCGNVCSATFKAGTPITLVASAPPGLVFVGWSGACVGTAPTCDLTVNGNLSVKASFSK